MANTHSTGDTALKPSAVKPKLPEMFKVLLLNDDYTPMEFVVETIDIQKVLVCVGFTRKTSRKPK
jgi:ATP-dependent Clp protease adaptor protein ClpS